MPSILLYIAMLIFSCKTLAYYCKEHQDQLDELSAKIKKLEQRQNNFSCFHSVDREHLIIKLGLDDYIGYTRPGNTKIRMDIAGWVVGNSMLTDDSKQTDLFFGTHVAYGPRLRVLGTSYVNPDIKVVGVMELDTNATTSTTFNQTARYSALPPVRMRDIGIYITSKDYGQFALGRGPSLLFASTSLDNTETAFAAYSISSITGGGLYYRTDDPNEDFTLNPQVRASLGTLEGYFRRDRLWYKSPIWNGFSLGSDIARGERRANEGDFVVNYQASNQCINVDTCIGIAYPWSPSFSEDEPQQEILGRLYSGIVTFLVKNGSFEGLGGVLRIAHVDNRQQTHPATKYQDRNPSFLYAKLAYQLKMFDVGKTIPFIDYSVSKNFGRINDSSQGYTVGFVQNYDSASLYLALLYKRYTLDRDNISFNPINLVSLSLLYSFGFTNGQEMID